MAGEGGKRGRLLKLVLGLALVAVAGYIIVGERLAGTSADAVVNARVATVRAPIDGELDLSVRGLGARLSANAAIGAIVDPRPDEIRLILLQREEADIGAEIERLERQLSTVATALDAFVKQSDTYEKGRIRQLEARLAEARANVDAAGARVRESTSAFRRATELSDRGVQTAAGLDRARSTFEVNTQELESARFRINYLQIELEAAKAGTFLGDSYNDAPYSQQRIRELELRVGEINADLNERRRRIKVVQSQIAGERVRQGKLREARLTSPADSVLWEVMAGSGEYVRKGQDLLKLIDCSTLMVTASVGERVYNNLKVGDQARFRLLGDDKVYDGTIVRLAGPGALGVYGSLAIGVSQEHLTRFDVSLLFPTLVTDPAIACGVGRTGRVVFSSRPLDLWRKLAADFGL